MPLREALSKDLLVMFCLSVKFLHLVRDILGTCTCSQTQLKCSVLLFKNLYVKPKYKYSSQIKFAKLDLASVSNAFPHISFFACVWDLSIILDQEFSKHIYTLSRTCYYQL